MCGFSIFVVSIFFKIYIIDVQVATVKKRAHLLREALVALSGAPSLSARGGHIPRRINSKKMLEGMLVKGKSMGRLYALMIQESIAAARIKRNRRPPTPSSKGSSKLGTPKSGFNFNCARISHLQGTPSQLPSLPFFYTKFAMRLSLSLSLHIR